MAVLKWLPRSLPGALLGATACYSPELQDCAVTCAADGDCGPGQVCGSDRMCAVPTVAGSCARGGRHDAGLDLPGDFYDANASDATGMPDAPMTPDAAVPPVDAWIPDASLPPPPPPPPVDAAPADAPIVTTVPLRVKINGNGRVDVIGHGTCDQPPGDCVFAVPAGQPVTLIAVPASGWHFDQWNATCGGQPATCTTLPAPAPAHARFRANDDDDDDDSD